MLENLLRLSGYLIEGVKVGNRGKDYFQEKRWSESPNGFSEEPLQNHAGKIILPPVRTVDMTLDDAKKALIAVLKDIQSKSGLSCPPLADTDVPPKVLEKFDSTVWPAATTLVARKLGVAIPHDVHIFGGEKGGALLTINQAAQLIVKKHLPKSALQEAS